MSSAVSNFYNPKIMKSKKSLLTSAVVALCVLAAPMAMAAGRGGHGGGSFAGSRGGFAGSRGNFSGARPGYYGARPGYAMQRGNYYSRHGNGNWHGGGNWHGNGHYHGYGHHYYGYNNIYYAGYGFPFWGYYGFGWGYPYWGGYYPYDGGYYYNEGAPVYEGRTYDGQVPDGKDASLVLQVQRRLARAGYYHGAIDGVIGGGTRGAIRAYERSHGLPVDGVIDDDLLATMGLS